MAAATADLEAVGALESSAVTGSFAEFFAVHFDRVHRSLSVAVGDAERAEELTQEAFTRACRKWRTVSQLDRPATWVYVVAVREDRRRLRRDKAGEALMVQASSGDTDTDRTTGVLAQLVVRQALAQLPPRQRMAVVLRHLAGLTTAEIAEAMACAEGTVKATVSAGLRNLRVRLEGDGE